MNEVNDEKGRKSEGKMADSQRLNVEKGIQPVKIFYETKNSRETARRLRQRCPNWQKIFEKQ